MHLWPLALLALLAALIFQLDAIFPDALRAEGATERLVYLGLLLAFLLAWGVRLRPARLKAAALMVLAWTGIFLVVIAAYAFRDEARFAFDRVRGEISPTLAVSREDGVVELRKAWDGHFHARAEVNGRSVRMLVDTGASTVLLSHEDAEALGLDPAGLAFTQAVTTANGRAFVAPVRLERVTIGAISLGDVRAAVAEKGKVRSSLLGMSFLGRLQETSFRGDQLILRN